MLSQEDLKELESKLLREKSELESEIQNVEKTAPDFGTDTDSFEEESDEAEEFSTQFGIDRTLKERLDDVKAALEKIGSGAYGMCEKCRGEISLELLRLDPESRYCRQCKQVG
ncbi:MAG: hypothetical protein HZA37_02035 [Parcubacteria group bacterium]|nr:hypothetical protein [Parcubacteria group bacterium]